MHSSLFIHKDNNNQLLNPNYLNIVVNDITIPVVEETYDNTDIISASKEDTSTKINSLLKLL